MIKTNTARLRVMDSKIRWIFLFSLIALTFFLIVLYQQMRRQEATRFWVSHTNQTIKKIDSIGVLLSETESATRGYLITKDTAWLKEIFLHYVSLTQSFTDLQKLTSDNARQQNNIKELRQLCAEKQIFQKKFLSGDYNDTLLKRIRPGGESLKINQSIKGILRSIREIEEGLLSVRIIQNENSYRTIIYTALIGGFFAFFLVLAILFQLNSDMYLRKKAEDTSSISESKYKTLIENAGVVMYTIDRGGVITFVNHQVSDLTGYTVEELIGKHFTTLLNPEWIEKVSAFYYNQLQDKTAATTLDFQTLTKLGSIKWVEQYAQLLYEDEQVSGFQCMVKDITAQKEFAFNLTQSEQKRKENEYRLNAIMDAASTLIFIKDLQGRYLMVNKRFKEFFHLSEESIILKTDYDIAPKEMADQYILSDKKVIAGLQAIESEEIAETDFGKRNMFLIKFPLLDDNHKLFGIGGIATDITDRVQSRKDLETALKNTEAAKQLQEQFLANMSHEIRTPLNGIQGMTSLLMETELTIDQKEYTTMIKHSLNNLTTILNDVLDFSNIQAGKITLEKIEFKLRELLAIIKDQFIHHMRSKGLDFQLLINSDVPETIIGDPYRLKQVLVNLIGNAIKFTKVGSIKIKVALQNKKSNEASILFSVEDTGIGIAEDKLDTIFERFVQANMEISKHYGGAGLGLTISRGLVHLLGGEIFVKSKSGEGTTFSFYIPYGLTKQTDKPSDHLDFIGKLKDKKFLVVEDNVINQKLIEYVLHNVGAEVEIASHGKEAIEYIEQKKAYDLIIMDLQMPVMDGYETAAYIRERLQMKIPIIAMTATALKGDQEKCKLVGMNDFMLKPFDFSDLYTRIIHLLGMGTEEAKEPDKNTIPDSKIYNLSLLEELDDKEALLDVLTLFLDNAPSEVKNLPYLLEQKNWAALYKLAHKIKGAIAILQARGLAELLGKIEENAKEEKNLVEITKHVNETITLFGELELALHKEIAIIQKELS